MEERTAMFNVTAIQLQKLQKINSRLSAQTFQSHKRMTNAVSIQVQQLVQCY